MTALDTSHKPATALNRPVRAAVTSHAETVVVFDLPDGTRVPASIVLRPGDEIDVIVPDHGDPTRVELVGFHRRTAER
jgi:hypothetical protein